VLNLGAEVEMTFERELVGITLRVDKSKVEETIGLVS
jgi:hypothetical protein